MPGPSGTSTLAVGARAGQRPSERRLKSCGLCQCQGPAQPCGALVQRVRGAEPALGAFTSLGDRPGLSPVLVLCPGLHPLL